MTRRAVALLVALSAAGAVGVALLGASQAAPALPVERRVQPVILNGAQIPDWSKLPADGTGEPYPSGNGSNTDPNCDPSLDRTCWKFRDAYNGEVAAPPDEQRGVSPDRIVGYRWTGTRWREIPVQVDERFKHYLANGRSTFAIYSGTDEELTYEWDVESWKKIYGTCFARGPEAEEDDPSFHAYGQGFPVVQDPVRALDDDDEVVFMASDAGQQAPADAPAPDGTLFNPQQGAVFPRQEVRLTDPLDPTTDRFVYFFLKEGGSSFTADNGYVAYERNANADQWIDRDIFLPADPEKLGTSNGNYGPNLHGTVCADKPATPTVETEYVSTARGRAAPLNGDRFPRDGVTVSTGTYQWRASGRWMVRQLHVARPGTPGTYGPDLIDRFKGRAFRQNPDADFFDLAGFEDEQTNWEANAALLGERFGPVRAIRETWGADSGTNVTKLEYFYRDLVAYRYFMRVHPIPPDGIYTSWDHNHDTVGRYFNETLTKSGRAAGVAIDGENDDQGNLSTTVPDQIPEFGDQVDTDVVDPSFSGASATFNWEQVTGLDQNGTLVYMFRLNNVQGAENPEVVPYYRDDRCFDDGTGDDPSPRLFPGESYEELGTKGDDPQTSDNESQIARSYLDRPCYGDKNADGSPKAGPYRQACFGCIGLHYVLTNETDNGTVPKPITEIDGQQFVWITPSAAPRTKDDLNWAQNNVGERYANTEKFPLVPFVTPQNNGDPPTSRPEPSASRSSSGSPSQSPSPARPRSPGDTEAPAEPGRASTSLHASRGKVRYKRPFALSGVVEETAACTGPYIVRIHKRSFGSDTAREVAATQPVPAGEAWRVELTSRVNASYWATVDDKPNCDGTTSAAVDLLVRAKVILWDARCRTRIVRGRVVPNQRTTKVTLSRARGNRWIALDADRLDRRSRYVLRPRGRCSGKFRVFWTRQGVRNIAAQRLFWR